MVHLLLVENDKAAAVRIARALLAEDHSVAIAHNGAEGLLELQQRSTALLIVNSLLPDISGTALVDAARGKGYRGPVLLLAPARQSTTWGINPPDRAGVKPCVSLARPFAMAELVALASLLLRRRLPDREVVVRGGDMADWIWPASAGTGTST